MEARVGSTITASTTAAMNRLSWRAGPASTPKEPACSAIGRLTWVVRIRNPSGGRLSLAAEIGRSAATAISAHRLDAGQAVEPVAGAPDRHDLERHPAGELLAEPAHVDVDRLAVAHEVDAPDL